MNDFFLGSFTLKPKILVFFISYNCNLRCLMCSCWIKQKQVREPSLDEIRCVFNDRILRDNLEIINITGGEPTLRQDLCEIIKIILEKCSRLKRIDISTNGVNTEQVIDQIERILTLLLPTNVRLTVSISLDGIGDVHEQVRQTKGIFKRIEQTVDGLQEVKTLYPFFDLGANMTITKLNYNAIEDIKRYTTQRGLGISFTLSAISDIGVESALAKEKFEMNQEEKNKVALSIRKLTKENAINPRYAKFLFTWLRTGRRSASCSFRKDKALLLEPDGNVYACGNFRDFAIGNIFNEPLEVLEKKKIRVLNGFWNKCATCVSNCYMDR